MDVLIFNTWRVPTLFIVVGGKREMFTTEIVTYIIEKFPFNKCVFQELLYTVFQFQDSENKRRWYP